MIFRDHEDVRCSVCAKSVQLLYVANVDRTNLLEKQNYSSSATIDCYPSRFGASRYVTARNSKTASVLGLVVVELCRSLESERRQRQQKTHTQNDGRGMQRSGRDVFCRAEVRSPALCLLCLYNVSQKGSAIRFVE